MCSTEEEYGGTRGATAYGARARDHAHHLLLHTATPPRDLVRTRAPQSAPAPEPVPTCPNLYPPAPICTLVPQFVLRCRALMPTMCDGSSPDMHAILAPLLYGMPYAKRLRACTALSWHHKDLPRDLNETPCAGASCVRGSEVGYCGTSGAARPGTRCARLAGTPRAECHASPPR